MSSLPRLCYPIAMDAGSIEIFYSKLYDFWYVRHMPDGIALSGSFKTEAEAKAWLSHNKQALVDRFKKKKQ